MSVYRVGKTWKADVYAFGEKVKTKGGFKSKSEASHWVREVMMQYSKDPAMFSEKRNFTFEHLMEEYVAKHLSTVRPSTRERYLIDLNQRIYPFFKYRRLENITPILLEEFKRSVADSGLSPKSVNNCIDLLASMLKRAERWRMVEKCPMLTDRMKVPPKDWHWWEDKRHVALFLNTARSSRYFAAYWLALDCGLRLGEILGLTPEDIDLKECQIKVTKQWLDKQNEYGPTKHNRNRTVSFDPDSGLREALREAIKRSSHVEAIFVTKSGKRVRNRKLAGEHFQLLVKKAGVPRIRFHDLRHTFASWYMRTEGDIWSLMNIMGHQDVQTTQRYAHFSAKHQRRMSVRWDESFGSESGLARINAKQKDSSPQIHPKEGKANL